MNIQKINTTNYNYNNNVNFKSKIVATKYINDLLDKGIKDPSGFSRIVDGFHRILNDGKDDIVKISYDKNKFWQFLFPGSYSIKINNEKPFTNTHFCGKGIEVQGEFALKEVYRDEYGNLIPCNEPSIAESPKIKMYRKRIHANWENLFKEYDTTNNRKRIKNLHKNMDFLQRRLNDEIRAELIKIKKIIFTDGKIVD